MSFNADKLTRQQRSVLEAGVEVARIIAARNPTE